MCSPSNFRLALNALLLFAAAGSMCSCGGAAAQRGDAVANTPAAADPADTHSWTADNARALPQLPTPQSISPQTLRSTAHAGADGEFTVAWGRYFAPDLPHANTAPGDAGLDFNPNWPSDGGTLEDLAYACYVLTSWGTGAEQVFVDWFSAPASNNWYLGLSDWTRDSWRWFPGTVDGVVPVTQLQRYTNLDGDMLACVLCLGDEPATLSLLRAGQESLHAIFYAFPRQGPPPLETHFAIQSIPNLPPVVQCEWDPEGDGDYLNSGEIMELDHAYSEPGYYEAGLRARSADGQLVETLCQIFVYNETEDNDGFSGANAAPQILGGHIGNTFSPDDYDGDDTDYFTSSAAGTRTVQLFYPTDSFKPLSVHAYDGSKMHTAASVHKHVGMVELQLTDVSFGENYLVVNILEHGSPYAWLFAGGAPPTAECSYSPAKGPAPLTVDFDASSSTDSGAAIASFEWDWNGDGLYEESTSAVPTISHMFNSRGLSMVRLRVTDASGLVDIERLPVMLGAFDDFEDNDSFGQAQEFANFATKITGHCGSGSFNNDGDAADFYKYEVPPGSYVVVSLIYDGEAGDLDLALYDAEFDLVTTASDGLDEERIFYYPLAGEVSPFYVVVQAVDGGGSAYELNLSSYFET